MVFAKKRVKIKHLVQHKHKHKSLMKYLSLLVLLLLYLFYIIHKYNFKDSIMITLLTWSFFIFCTPIADAGFLLDFPIRVLFNIRMLYTEMIVWVIGISLNAYALMFIPEIYQKVAVLEIFYHIMTNPFPFWLIILISAIGTFMSVIFADELMEVIEHHHRKIYHKHKGKFYWAVTVFIIIATIILYDYMIVKLGLNF